MVKLHSSASTTQSHGDRVAIMATPAMVSVKGSLSMKGSSNGPHKLSQYAREEYVRSSRSNKFGFIANIVNKNSNQIQKEENDAVRISYRDALRTKIQELPVSEFQIPLAEGPRNFAEKMFSLGSFPQFLQRLEFQRIHSAYKKSFQHHKRSSKDRNAAARRSFELRSSRKERLVGIEENPGPYKGVKLEIEPADFPFLCSRHDLYPNRAWVMRRAGFPRSIERFVVPHESDVDEDGFLREVDFEGPIGDTTLWLDVLAEWEYPVFRNEAFIIPAGGAIYRYMIETDFMAILIDRLIRTNRHAIAHQLLRRCYSFNQRFCMFVLDHLTRVSGTAIYVCDLSLLDVWHEEYFPDYFQRAADEMNLLLDELMVYSGAYNRDLAEAWEIVQTKLVAFAFQTWRMIPYAAEQIVSRLNPGGVMIFSLGLTMFMFWVLLKFFIYTVNLVALMLMHDIELNPGPFDPKRHNRQKVRFNRIVNEWTFDRDWVTKRRNWQHASRVRRYSVSPGFKNWIPADDWHYALRKRWLPESNEKLSKHGLLLAEIEDFSMVRSLKHLEGFDLTTQWMESARLRWVDHNYDAVLNELLLCFERGGPFLWHFRDRPEELSPRTENVPFRRWSEVSLPEYVYSSVDESCVQTEYDLSQLTDLHTDFTDSEYAETEMLNFSLYNENKYSMLDLEKFSFSYFLPNLPDLAKIGDGIKDFVLKNAKTAIIMISTVIAAYAYCEVHNTFLKVLIFFIEMALIAMACSDTICDNVLSMLKFGSTREVRTEAGVDNGPSVTVEFDDLLESLGTLVCGGLLAISTTEAVHKKDLSKFTRALSSVTGCRVGVMNIVKWTLSLIKSFSLWISGQNVLDEFPILANRYPKIGELERRLYAFQKKMREESNYNYVTAQEGFALATDIDVAAAEIPNGDETMKTLKAQLWHMGSRLKPLLDCLTVENLNGGTRGRPLGVWLGGASGVWKSTCVKELFNEIWAEVATDEEWEMHKNNPGKSIFPLDYTREFWDGYAKNFCVVVDEAGMVREIAGAFDDGFMAIIRMINIFDFDLNMADLPRKGKTKFLSKVVIATSNRFRIDKIESLYYPDAYVNRFDVAFHQFPRREYCLNPDEKVFWNRKWDPNKFPELIPGKPLPKHMLCWVKIELKTGKYLSSELSWDQVVDMCVVAYKRVEHYNTCVIESLKEAVKTADCRRTARKLAKNVVINPDMVGLKDPPSESSNVAAALRRAKKKEKEKNQEKEIELMFIDPPKNKSFDDLVEKANEKSSQASEVKSFLSDITSDEESPPLVEAQTEMGAFDFLFNPCAFAIRYVESKVEPMVSHKASKLLRDAADRLSKPDEPLMFEGTIAHLIKDCYRIYELPEEYLEMVAKKQLIDPDKFIDWCKDSQWHSELIPRGVKVHEWLPTRYRETILAPTIDNFVDEFKEWWGGFNGLQQFGIIAGGLAILGSMAAIVGLLCSTEVEVVETQSGSSKQKTASKKTAKRARQRLVNYGKVNTEALFMTPDMLNRVVANANSNSYSLQISTTGPDGVFSGNLGYVNTIYKTLNQCPRHYYDEFESIYADDGVDDLVIRLVAADGSVYGWFYWSLVHDDFCDAFGVEGVEFRGYPDPDIDHSFFKLPNSPSKYCSGFQDRPSLLNCFIPEDKRSFGGDVIAAQVLTDVRGAKSRIPVTVELRYQGAKDYFTRFPKVEGQEEREPLRYFSKDTYWCYRNTYKGACGSSYWVTDTASPVSYIVGVHVAGTGSCAYIAATTREMMADAVQQFYPDFVLPKAFTESAIGNQFKVLGHINPVYTNARNNIVPSVVHGKWGPARLVPADVSSYKDGSRVDPLAPSREKVGKNTAVLDQEVLDIVTMLYVDDIMKCPEGHYGHGMIPYYEAVAGRPGILKGIPLGTSAGFMPGMPPRSNGKHDFFGHDGYDFTKVEALGMEERVLRQLDMCRRGKLPVWIYKDACKVELRPPGKACRQINGAPVDKFILSRMLFGSFVLHLADHKLHNGSALGINVLGDDWHVLAKELKRVGKLLAGDFSGWDGSLTVQMMRSIQVAYRAFYRDQPEADNLARDVLFEDLIRSKHLVNVFTSSLDEEPLNMRVHIEFEDDPNEAFIMPDFPDLDAMHIDDAKRLLADLPEGRYKCVGTSTGMVYFVSLIYVWEGGMPSGDFWTTPGNIIINNVIQRYAAVQAVLKKHGSELFPNTPLARMKFLASVMVHENCYVVAFGDDHLVAYTPYMQSLINPYDISVEMGLAGLKYTDENKQPPQPVWRDLEEVSFLSGAFRYEQKLSRYVFVLKLETIREMLYWHKSILQPGAFLQTVSQTFRYLSYHGEDVFNENLKDMGPPLREAGFNVPEMDWFFALLSAAGTVLEHS